MTLTRYGIVFVVSVLAFKDGGILVGLILLLAGLTWATFRLLLMISVYRSLDARGGDWYAPAPDDSLSDRRFAELLIRGPRVKLAIACLLLVTSLFTRLVWLPLLLALWVAWEIVWILVTRKAGTHT